MSATNPLTREEVDRWRGDLAVEDTEHEECFEIACRAVEEAYALRIEAAALRADNVALDRFRTEVRAGLNDMVNVRSTPTAEDMREARRQAGIE